jgi:hypothetical protein
MVFLVYGIGFVVCYFVLHFDWWMSLLIALAFPAALGIVMLAVGMPMAGISVLVEKIKERRQRRHSEQNLQDTYQVIEQRKEEQIPPIAMAEYFVLDFLDKETHTRAELNRQGKAMGYSETTVGKAITNLMELGEIERIARGVYRKIGTLPIERTATGESAEATRISSVAAEIAKERKKQSNTFGIWSLILGIVGVFWWPEALGAAAVVLGVLQFRRHISKRAIAGFTLGIVNIVLALVFQALGLYLLGL